jgi:hypothetical protein
MGQQQGQGIKQRDYALSHHTIFATRNSQAPSSFTISLASLSAYSAVLESLFTRTRIVLVSFLDLEAHQMIALHVAYSDIFWKRWIVI